MPKRELIFIVQAYLDIVPPDGRLADSCQLELYAENEKEAIERAKKIIKKNHYRVAQVIEK